MKEYIEEETQEPEKTEVTKEELTQLINECKKIRHHRYTRISSQSAPDHGYLLGQYLAWEYTVCVLENWVLLDATAKDLFGDIKDTRDSCHQGYLFYDKRSQSPGYTLSQSRYAGLCDGYFAVVTMLSDFLKIDYPIINDKEE